VDSVVDRRVSGQIGLSGSGGSRIWIGCGSGKSSGWEDVESRFGYVAALERALVMARVEWQRHI
jgi:hypothetical protein